MIYHLDVPLAGTLYREEIGSMGFFHKNKTQLHAGELVKYQRQIDYLFHDIEKMEDANDNGQILKGIEYLLPRWRVNCADISACEVNGKLYGRIEFITGGRLGEKEQDCLSEHVKRKLHNNWGERYQEKLIEVDGGWLQIHLDEPEKCILTEQKKYEITDIEHSGYPSLHRIRALIDVGEDVCAGDLGGYVQSEKNLRHDDTCWIYDNAICCEDAVVGEDASLHGASMARGDAILCGTAKMYDNALADDYCVIRNGEIRFQARIAGEAVIDMETHIALSPVIAGTSQIYGTVRGQYHIDDIVLPGEVLRNPTKDLFILEKGHRSVIREKKPLYFKDKKKKPNQKSSEER